MNAAVETIPRPNDSEKWNGLRGVNLNLCFAELVNRRGPSVKEVVLIRLIEKYFYPLLLLHKWTIVRQA